MLVKIQKKGGKKLTLAGLMCCTPLIKYTSPQARQHKETKLSYARRCLSIKALFDEKYSGIPSGQELEL